MIDFHSVLELLRTDSQVPSSFGSQLYKLRDGVPTIVNPTAAKEAQESLFFTMAPMYRCVREMSTIKDANFIPAHSALRVACPTHLGLGEFAIRVVKTYQSWQCKSPARAYTAVLSLLKLFNPTLPDNKAFTVEVVDHSLMILEAWVKYSNAKQ